MSIIFKDENESWQIDFSSALWATDKLNEKFSIVKGSLLSDVDFVAEAEDFVLFVESKNSNFKEAKHVCSLISDRNKRKIYIYLLETRNGDSVFRKRVRNRIKDLLPFKLQRDAELYEKMIDDFDVLNLDEWNKYFKQFPAQRLKNSITDN